MPKRYAPLSSWYDVRARHLLARYQPTGCRTMDPADRLLLAYVIDPPPIEAKFLERLVGNDIGFGVAMSLLFSEMGLASTAMPKIIAVAVSMKLSDSLHVEPASLLGALHGKLSAMVNLKSDLNDG